MLDAECGKVRSQDGVRVDDDGGAVAAKRMLCRRPGIGRDGVRKASHIDSDCQLACMRQVDVMPIPVGWRE